MLSHRSLLLSLLAMTAGSPMAIAASPRVMPSSLPLPLPETRQPLTSAQPIPPDRLRARNPWILSMNGDWRFKLTHGSIVDDRFSRSLLEAKGMQTSSMQGGHPPEHAFDQDTQTRWCASSGSFPQWLQADLGVPHRVTGVNLKWERDTETYRCRLEGSLDGKRWVTLADKTAGEGVGSGLLRTSGSEARFVRLAILSASDSGWASLWDCGIQYIDDQGKTARWSPPTNMDLSPPPGSDDFIQPAFYDTSWDKLAVPSNWEMAGYSIPTYNAVDDTVGLYRRWVTVPASWADRKIIWHFDGALDGAEIFVNGQKAGYHESGYTAFDVDLTGLVKPGQRNLFAVRLSKTTPSVECDTGDYQSLGGIYRDTSLIAVPKTHVSDITVRTPLTNNNRDAVLNAAVTVSGTPGESVSVTGALVGPGGKRWSAALSGKGTIGADGTASIALSSPVRSPLLWSAEKPSLYYLVLDMTGASGQAERVEQRFGFREITIKNNTILWNGQPIKCTGVCRHDFWADKGYALTDREWNKDLDMMKAANINAIRTSHYNHAARFLELCDEKGMYILDEVPFCWIDEHVKDPAFIPFLRNRATDTVMRDKNRPCVLAWSLGNENPIGPDTQDVFDLVKKLDPTRPAFASGGGPWNIKGQEVWDTHYPGPDGVQHYIDVDSSKAPAIFTEHPHTFCNKPAQDFDPGVSDMWSEGLIKTWDTLWKHPQILGSFIWEWQCQGIADKYPDHTTDFYYGLDHMRQENNKGIVSAYRVTKPEWWIVKNIYSPVVITARTVNVTGGACSVPVTNHYSFTDLQEAACRWTALQGDTVLKSGTQHIACAPMQTVQASFPVSAGMTALRLQFLRPDGVEIVSTRVAVTGTSLPQPTAALASGGVLQVTESGDALTVSNGIQRVVFSKQNGALQQWRVRGASMIDGPAGMNFGEGKEGRWNEYYRAASAPVTQNSTVSAQRQANGAVAVTVASSVLDRIGGDTLGHLDTTYDITPDAQVKVRWTLKWSAASTHMWEIGMRLPVARGLSHMAWSQDSWFTDYPKGQLGEPSGECTDRSPVFRGSKNGLHWLTVTDKTGHGLALLQAGAPLVGRGEIRAGHTNLLASSNIAAAGPDDLSRSWYSDHEIVASPEHPLTGAFTLRAIGE